jgi:hypothetical protein
MKWAGYDTIFSKPRLKRIEYSLQLNLLDNNIVETYDSSQLDLKVLRSETPLMFETLIMDLL